MENSLGRGLYFDLLGNLLYQNPRSGILDVLDDGLFAELPFAEENKLALEGAAQVTTWLCRHKNNIHIYSAESLEIDYVGLAE